MKKLAGKVSIFRTQGNDGLNSVIIELADGASLLRVVEIQMSMEEFALAVTGVGYQSASYALPKVLDRFGKIKETKTIHVAFGRRSPSNTDYKAHLLARLETMGFLQDGWEPDTNELRPGHHESVDGNGNSVVSVTLHRYV